MPEFFASLVPIETDFHTQKQFDQNPKPPKPVGMSSNQNNKKNKPKKILPNK